MILVQNVSCTLCNLAWAAVMGNFLPGRCSYFYL